MHHQVVVQEHHISLLHLHLLSAVQGHFVQVLQPFRLDLFSIITIEDIRFVDARRTGRLLRFAVDLLALAAEMLGVRMHGAPPAGLARGVVSKHRILGHRADLQNFAAIIVGLFPSKLSLEVNFHLQGLGHGSVDHGLHRWLHKIGKSLDEAHGKLRRGIDDISIVDFCQPLLVKLLEHLSAVRNQEFAALFSGLEAHKESSSRCPIANHLIVHTDVELASGRFVHSLIDACLLIHCIPRSH
mmetsp:Transcript_12984/g.22534  ORF Transcript_12984/g.22534 Transcript_12984/m.22534 type:complete len:242 (-) Transcript_12984:593-1318(-)